MRMSSTGSRPIALVALVALGLAGCPTTVEEPCSADIAVWEDLDGDGYGGASLGKVCAIGEGEVEIALDCDDADEMLNPDQIETCDGIDNDCDGQIDDDAGLTQYWWDRDGDGFGGDFQSQLACASPGDEWTRNSDDCDDGDPAVNPDGQEVCGGIDEDCDGYLDESDDSVDPDSFSTFYGDGDGDGYGDPNNTIERCRLIPGYVLEGNDCNDSTAAVTQFDFWEDLDGDGFGNSAVMLSGCRPVNGMTDNPDDCDDTDPALTVEFDWYQDLDADGFGAGVSVAFQCVPPDADSVSESGDCDDLDPARSPGAPEICNDGIDQDCNGVDDGEYVEDWESGSIGPDWTVGGNSAWQVGSTRYEGSFGSNNGNIADNQNSFASLTIDLAAAGTVSFWHSGSTEGGWDYLRFKVDGVERMSRAGSWGWLNFSYPLTAGTHTLRWEYTKDGSVSTGSDTVWVDLIEISGGCN